MSVIQTFPNGYLISHSDLINEFYRNIINEKISLRIKSELFDIKYPFKEPKRKSACIDQAENEFGIEVEHVKELYNSIRNDIKVLENSLDSNINKNVTAVDIANSTYVQSGKCEINNISGGNLGEPVVKQLENASFLFPENCEFHCRDVKDIEKYLKGQFDLILLDPPWWNKYIRRKRKYSDQGYDMMYNNDLKNIPIESYLNENGLVVVWCTNSVQHFTTLKNEIFPKWGVEYLGKWYWIKITKSGQPICEFSKPPRKQPFEQIIFGIRNRRKINNPICDKIVISVPSAIHSHKPPLIKLLEPYLPENPKCLELFARYLLPGWTSYGKEVLRLQHNCLYEEYFI